MMTSARLRTKFYPYRESIGMGNIIWAECDRGNAYYRVSKFAPRDGRFPPDHPAAPGGSTRSDDQSQVGASDQLTMFRSRGYWASCFPEGDGITWKPLNGQSDQQCLVDISECFPKLAVSREVEG